MPGLQPGADAATTKPEVAPHRMNKPEVCPTSDEETPQRRGFSPAPGLQPGADGYAIGVTTRRLPSPTSVSISCFSSGV